MNTSHGCPYCRTVLCLWDNAASVVYLPVNLPVFVVSPAVRHNHQKYAHPSTQYIFTSFRTRTRPPSARSHIALYGRVRCRGRGHDIVGSHDIVGGLTISWWYDIVSPSTISAREYDIVPQSRYRVCVRYRSRGAISSFARDIAGPRGNIVGLPTISWPGRGIVPTRVIVSARRDIVRPATLS